MISFYINFQQEYIHISQSEYDPLMLSFVNATAKRQAGCLLSWIDPTPSKFQVSQVKVKVGNRVNYM